MTELEYKLLKVLIKSKGTSCESEDISDLYCTNCPFIHTFCTGTRRQVYRKSKNAMLKLLLKEIL